MDLLADLNPAQREAVQTVEGALLVHAGPGSGKTRVITHRIAYMIQNASINPRNILAVTFSKKAADEMKKRLSTLLTDKSSALSICTIHAACLRILRKDGTSILGTNFEVIDEEGRSKLIRQCLEKAGLESEETDIKRFKNGISLLKNALPGATVTTKPPDESLARVFEIYQESLKGQGTIDYDDMLLLTYRLLRDDESVLAKYRDEFRYILVDEFQDTSGLQYQILKMLGQSHGNICAVGDPDQTIYSWRQANVKNINDFRRDFPATRIIGMDENYRSSKTIVDAANALIVYNRLHKEKRLKTTRQKGDPISVVKLENEAGEADFITREIRNLMKEQKSRYSDFAVLYRINAQSRALEEAFITAGIPYRLLAGTPYYQRREVLDMAAWLRVIRNPLDDAALLRVIKFAGKGIGVQTINSLYAQAGKSSQHFYTVLKLASSGKVAELAPRLQTAIARFYAMVEELRASGKHISTDALLSLILEKSDYQSCLKKEDNADERWSNVMELISLARADDHLSPSEALEGLLHRIKHITEASDQETGADAVFFNTLHGSKGTEFPIVFIAGMEEGILPHSKSMDTAERLEEERRLCYVGLTRAMERVYLLHTEKRRFSGIFSYSSPSRFIHEIPDHLKTSRDLSEKPVPGIKPAPVSAKGVPVAAAAAAPCGAMDLSVGDTVRHPKFGCGRIVEIEKITADHNITVEFTGQVVRTFLFNLARLEKMDLIE